MKMRVFTRSSQRKEAHVQCGKGTTLCQGPSCLVSTLQGVGSGCEDHAEAWTPNASRRGERGSAVIFVLILAMIMAALIADNGLVLHRLKQEIKLIEKKQAKKYQQPPHHAPARGARTALSAQTPVSELADMAVRAPAGRPVAQEADAHTSVSVAPQPKPDKAP